jgi:cysteine desulfuration protein SufE
MLTTDRCRSFAATIRAELSGTKSGQTRMDVDELVENFELLGDWEERYRYLIDLGRKLPPMPDADHIDANKVRGCMSQVWLTHQVQPGPPPTLEFQGDSDAHIVKGLIALLLKLSSGRTPQQILDTDIGSIFTRLGLESHITMNRRNGFYSMVERIRQMAAQAVTGAN